MANYGYLKRPIDDLVALLNSTRAAPQYPLTGSSGGDAGANFLDCNEVYPGLFVGDESSARNIKGLKMLGVTHVVNTAEGRSFGMVNTSAAYYQAAGINYLGLCILDLPDSKIENHFQSCAEFIDVALQSGGKALVHCLMGYSRSATIAIAFLMMRRGMTVEVAMTQVKTNREVRPNDGFIQQLKDLGDRLQAERSNSHSEK